MFVVVHEVDFAIVVGDNTFVVHYNYYMKQDFVYLLKNLNVLGFYLD